MIWSKNKMNFTHAPVRMIRRFFNMNQWTKSLQSFSDWQRITTLVLWNIIIVYMIIIIISVINKFNTLKNRNILLKKQNLQKFCLNLICSSVEYEHKISVAPW